MESVCWTVFAGQCLLDSVCWTVSAGQCLIDSVWLTVSDWQCLIDSVWLTVSAGQCLIDSVWLTVSDWQCLIDSVWWTISWSRCKELDHKTLCCGFASGLCLCSLSSHIINIPITDFTKFNSLTNVQKRRHTTFIIHLMDTAWIITHK